MLVSTSELWTDLVFLRRALGDKRQDSHHLRRWLRTRFTKNMMIDSKLILTSRNSVTGVNLYTFLLTYPRVILPEVNTHRALSRNTASSRAIPSWKQRSRVLAIPFVPVSIGKNQKGMQAGEELGGWRRAIAINTWKLARYSNVFASWILEKVGAHKQVVNRIVEPWTWTQQIVSATDLNNVFKLRNHPDAEPHFKI